MRAQHAALDALGCAEWTARPSSIPGDLTCSAPFSGPHQQQPAPISRPSEGHQRQWPNQQPSPSTTCAPPSRSAQRAQPCAPRQNRSAPPRQDVCATSATPRSEASPVTPTRAMSMHSPDPLLHPVLLEFGTPELEAQFSARFMAARIGNSDVRSSVSTLLFHTLYCVLQVGLRWDRIHFAYCVVLLLHALATYAMATGRLPHRYRNPIVIATRLVCDTCIAAGMVTWNEPNGVYGWPTMVKHLLVNTGLCSIGYEALAYSLPLKVNVLVQPASALIFSYFMSPGCCRVLLSHATATSITSRIWSAVRWFCNAGLVMGRIEVLTPGILATISESPYLTCTASISFLQVMLGLFVPLMLLYASERTERQHFWASLHGFTAAEVATAARPHPLTKVGCGYLMLFVGLCFWEAAFVLIHLNSQQSSC